MNISLIYLNFPFWRAEVSRISLFLSNNESNSRDVNSIISDSDSKFGLP